KLFSFNIFFSIPIVILLFLLSENIITIFFGKEFTPSIIPMMIISINVLIISITNICGHQILYPNNKDKVIILSVFLGAIINAILNIILIPMYDFIGAAISLVVTELVIMMLRIYQIKPIISINLFKISYKYIFSGIPMSVFVLIFIDKTN